MKMKKLVRAIAKKCCKATKSASKKTHKGTYNADSISKGMHGPSDLHLLEVWSANAKTEATLVLTDIKAAISDILNRRMERQRKQHQRASKTVAGKMS